MAGPRPQKNTNGGWSTFTSYSSGLAAAGSSNINVSGPGDFLLQSGAGRLDNYLLQPSTTLGGVPNITSGGCVVFYDSAVATSGGPYVLSGHKVVAITTYPGEYVTASGFGANPLNPVFVEMPFQSGLCVALKSGQPGFTVAWSSEPASNF
jgi:hypothetical protein